MSHTVYRWVGFERDHVVPMEREFDHVSDALEHAFSATRLGVEEDFERLLFPPPPGPPVSRWRRELASWLESAGWWFFSMADRMDGGVRP